MGGGTESVVCKAASIGKDEVLYIYVRASPGGVGIIPRLSFFFFFFRFR